MVGGSKLDQDEKVIEELESQDMSGFTERGKIAILELAEKDQGAMIFLIISLNSRIRDLEKALLGHHNKEDRH